MPRLMGARVVLGAIAAIAVSVGGIPSADAARRSPKAASRLFVKAQKKAREGEYPAALRLLQKAYAADPKPKYVANQGITYMEMGQYEKAAERFDWFIENTDSADDEALAETFLSKLRPQVIIVSEPPGAEVFVDQVELGTTPLITEVVAGEHLLMVSKSGYDPVSLPLVVVLDEGQNLTLTLQMSAAREVELEDEPMNLIPAAPPPVLPAVRETGWHRSTWGWTAISAGVLVGAGGVTAGALAFGHTDDRDAADSRADWRAAQSDAEDMATLYYVGTAIAGAAIITGIALLIVGDDAPTTTGLAEGVGVGITF